MHDMHIHNTKIHLPVKFEDYRRSRILVIVSRVIEGNYIVGANITVLGRFAKSPEASCWVRMYVWKLHKEGFMSFAKHPKRKPLKELPEVPYKKAPYYIRTS